MWFSHSGFISWGGGGGGGLLPPLEICLLVLKNITREIEGERDVAA